MKKDWLPKAENVFPEFPYLVMRVFWIKNGWEKLSLNFFIFLNRPIENASVRTPPPSSFPFILSPRDPHKIDLDNFHSRLVGGWSPPQDFSTTLTQEEKQLPVWCPVKANSQKIFMNLRDVSDDLGKGWRLEFTQQQCKQAQVNWPPRSQNVLQPCTILKFHKILLFQSFIWLAPLLPFLALELQFLFLFSFSPSLHLLPISLFPLPASVSPPPFFFILVLHPPNPLRLYSKGPFPLCDPHCLKGISSSLLPWNRNRPIFQFSV